MIYAALWAGRGLSILSGELIPASILGMVLLTLGLQLRVIKLDWVERTASVFVRWMSLLFVPISVGLVEHLESLFLALPAMLITCIIGTLVLLVLVGKGYQYLEQRGESHS